MRLVFKNTGVEVTVGAAAKTFRGEEVTVTGIEKPRHAGSSGRVYVTFDENSQSVGFYPGVIGAEWVEREDR